MQALLDIVFGKHAEVISAAFGLVGALALAKAPMESLKVRRAFFQLTALDKDDLGAAADGVRTNLLQQLEILLDVERKWNIIGAFLLVISFGILIISKFIEALHG